MEGHLAKIVEDGKATEYVYDSAGNRMLAKNADGSTTAYLPGGNELSITSTGAKTATRYYTHGGETVAVRTSSGFSFLFGDHQGTAMIAITMGAAQTVTRRKQLPFGGQRSTTGSASWPGDRGFVGGTTDPTGYTHLGAREYDPSLGRFLSVDPLLLPDDPTQLNPYVYGNNNPVTFSDPTGEAYEECVSGQYNCTYGKSTGDVKKVSFGKNYKKETRTRGGTISKNYYAQQATGRKYTYTKGRGITRYSGAEYRRAEKLRQEKELKHRQYLSKREAELEALRNPPSEGNFIDRVGGWFADKGKKLAHSFSGDTTGMCLGASAGIGFGGTASICFVSTRRPDGKSDYGFSLSKGSETPSVGINAGLSFISSNATDFEQLRGDGWGGTVSGAYGIGATIGHERAIGAQNSRGEPVGTTSVGLLAGIGGEAGITTSHGTQVGRIGDIANSLNPFN
ncbi:RHS repeat-associated core domain-containing protein [Streptomyces parvus]|uniref:RHS repeat-associated core domain-containing protein n=1 Tax=Streptomyces parvus TaxID=66428 RepID=UPI0030B881BF